MPLTHRPRTKPCHGRRVGWEKARSGATCQKAPISPRSSRRRPARQRPPLRSGQAPHPLVVVDRVRTRAPCSQLPGRAHGRPKDEPRLSVPYSPFFLEQVREMSVAEITSEGTRRSRDRSGAPRATAESRPEREFETEIPLRGHRHVRALARRARGDRQAHRLDAGPPWWQTLLIGFGPTLLLVGLLIVFLRRASSAQRCTVLRPLASTPLRALRRQGHVRRRRRHRRGEERAREVVDFLRRPDKYRRSAAASRTGCCSSARPARARRCSPGPSRARRTCRSSRLAASSSSRRSSASAPRASRPLRPGQGRRAVHRLHRRARRDRSPRAGGGLQRRQRRARADPEPDPDRDGRLRLRPA